LKKKNWIKNCLLSKRNFYFWNVHTLDSAISSFHEFWLFCEIFFLEEKSWKKCVSSTKGNYHFKKTKFFKEKKILKKNHFLD
jgi:hypothetical protein